MKESNLRSIVKSITYRLLGSLTTFIIAFLITGESFISSSIAIIDLLSKLCLYWFHERMWLKIKWGYKGNK